MAKIPTYAYTEAFLGAIREAGEKKVSVEKFIEAIRRNGDWPRRYEILSACEKKWRKLQGKSLVTIESARELSPAQRSRLDSAWKDKNRDIRYRIDPSHIAGVKIIIDEEKQFDGSLLRKINRLFSGM